MKFFPICWHQAEPDGEDIVITIERKPFNMLSLNEATLNDFDFYYELKSERSAIYWGGFSEKPDIDKLKTFWENTVVKKDEKRKILIVKDGITNVGYVQAIIEDHRINFSLGISETARGKGYGKLSIELALDYFGWNREFYCHIREDNIPSIKSFTANGFHESDDGYIQFFPIDKKDFLMKRFDLHL